ncbi:MAG: NAD(P)/FAD-dependent oxidoreductase [Geminicoccaceae bacterium]
MSSDNSVIVIGAGIVGASIAYHLARRGADVLILDQTGPAAGATGKSFAWINANHSASDHYHRLRYQSLAEYQRLDRELDGALGLQWCGSLTFDVEGEDFDQRLRRFQALGYPVETVAHNQFGSFEPCYQHQPERAMRFALEGAVEAITATTALIDAAVGHGASTIFGATASRLFSQGKRRLGVATDFGDFAADSVIVAAGVGTTDLLGSVDIPLPMANRPGLMLHSRPIEPVLNHVIWGDRIHIKQQNDGRLVIGEIFSDSQAGNDPTRIAEAMVKTCRRHLPDLDIEIGKTTIGLRPIPEDGMPIIDRIPGIDSLYVAVMHNGITLAPIVGRLVTDEILDGTQFETLAPYRLNRFRRDATP